VECRLKNNPFVKVSCNFSRGQVDEKIYQELEFAINTNNISSMEDHSQETRREIRNLPDEVQLVQGCILAIQQAKAVAPTEANAMSDKLSRMLNAAISGDINEVDHL
jgi:molecular chaperone DnaK